MTDLDSLHSLHSLPCRVVIGVAGGNREQCKQRSQFLIHIPADAEYPALNLAQAVAVCLYELRRAWLKQTRPPVAAEPPAPFADQERMFEHLRAALEQIHFLYGTNADPLMHALRHLVGRAGPTPMEVELLHGLARQICWYVQHPRPLS